jgi:hypothetical protein
MYENLLPLGYALVV